MKLLRAAVNPAADESWAAWTQMYCLLMTQLCSRSDSSEWRTTGRAPVPGFVSGQFRGPRQRRQAVMGLL